MTGEQLTTGNAHTEAAYFGLAREHADLPVVARFTVTGEPQSKARARVGRHGAYTPDATKTAEEIIGWAFRRAARAYTPDPHWMYGVVCIFFAATRQRRDVDNMLKLVCDGLNKIAWVDDAQVVEISGRKVFVDDKAHARTEILIYRVTANLPPHRPCAHCGVMILLYESTTSSRKYCSRDCASAAAAERRRRPCAHCEEPFVPSSRAKYCSDECHTAATNVDLTCLHCGISFRRSRAKADQQHDLCSSECRTAYWRDNRAKAAKGVCESCGGSTSKKTYLRCRACHITDRQPTTPGPQGAPDA